MATSGLRLTQAAYANSVSLNIPDNEDGAFSMECTCDMPKRYLLPCHYVFAALRVIDNLHAVKKLAHEGYTLERYRGVNGDLGYRWAFQSGLSFPPPGRCKGRQVLQERDHVRERSSRVRDMPVFVTNLPARP